jgi:hypothetical protein
MSRSQPAHIREFASKSVPPKHPSRSNTVFAFAPFGIAELMSTGTVPDYFPPS